MGASLSHIAAGIALLAWMAALSTVDIRRHRLPNALTLPGAAVILAGAALSGHGLPAVVGAATLAGAYLAVHLRSPAAIGAGDVKLALGIGALTGALGADAWALAAVGAPLVTAVWGLLTGLRTVPHGPSMCVAALVAMGGS